MKSKFIFTSVVFFIAISIFEALNVHAQGIGINPSGNAPNSSAGLDVDFNNKGFLPPRLTSVERNAISNPANGLVIFNTTSNCLNYRANNQWLEVCGTCTPLPT